MPLGSFFGAVKKQFSAKKIRLLIVNFIPSWDSLDKFQEIIGVRSLYAAFMAPIALSLIRRSDQTYDFYGILTSNISVSLIIFLAATRILSAAKPENLIHVRDRSFENFMNKAKALDELLRVNASIDEQYRDFFRKKENDLKSLPIDEESRKKIMDEIDRRRIRLHPVHLVADYYEQLSVKGQRELNKSKPITRLIIYLMYIVSIVMLLLAISNGLDQAIEIFLVHE